VTSRVVQYTRYLRLAYVASLLLLCTEIYANCWLAAVQCAGGFADN
jgi:hypothetical protein